MSPLRYFLFLVAAILLLNLRGVFRKKSRPSASGSERTKDVAVFLLLVFFFLTMAWILWVEVGVFAQDGYDHAVTWAAACVLPVVAVLHAAYDVTAVWRRQRKQPGA